MKSAFLISLSLMACVGCVRTQDMGAVSVRAYQGAPQLFVDGAVKTPLSFLGVFKDGPRYVVARREWRRKRFSFDCPEDSEGLAELWIGFATSRPGTIWLDDIRMVEDGTEDGAKGNLIVSGTFETPVANAEELPPGWRFFIHPKVKTIDAGWQYDSVEKHSGRQSLRIDIRKNPSGANPWFSAHMRLEYKGLTLRKGRRYTVEYSLRGTPDAYVGIEVLHPSTISYTRGEDSVCIDQIKLAAAAGIHDHHVNVSIPFPRAGEKPDFALVDRTCAAMLAADPAGRIVLRFGVFPPAWWFEKNPEDWMQFQDGRRHRMVTTSSQRWWDILEPSLIAFIQHVEAAWGARILAYHPAAYEGAEWNYPGRSTPDNAGYGTVVEADFCRWLRDKYQTNAAFQRAWGQKAGDMAQVRLPTFERRHTPTHGEFLHPAEDRDLIDFFAFRNDRMADAMIRIAGIVKGASSLKRPVLFFYGYTFEINNGLIEGGHARWSRLLACDDIDLFCAPTAYFGRWPGHAGYFHAPVDSVALHGKMWFNEDDVRTYLIPGAKGRWTPRDLKQNIDNYERNFAHLFVRRMGCWYMDLLGRGWLNDPELWRGIGQLNVFWEKHKDDPVTFAPDIAIIADERSPYFMPHVRNNRGPSVNGPLLGQLRGKLGGVGAPVGYYLLPDFLADRIDAKVYVFLNAFAVTGAERKRFHEILKRRGATAVWLYGPGYVDPERKVLGTEGISALTGMATAQLAHPLPDTLRPVGGMTQLTGPGSETFGTGYSTIKSQWGILPGDSVTPLAVYETEPGTIGAAMTKRLGFTSIHIAGLSVSTELMRGIARQAGVWIYCDSGDAIVADDRFLMIHAASDGLKTIRLPVPRTVRDCLTDEVLVQGDVLKIKMKATETRLLRFE